MVCRTLAMFKKSSNFVMNDRYANWTNDYLSNSLSLKEDKRDKKSPSYVPSNDNSCLFNYHNTDNLADRDKLEILEWLFNNCSIEELNKIKSENYLKKKFKL